MGICASEDKKPPGPVPPLEDAPETLTPLEDADASTLVGTGVRLAASSCTAADIVHAGCSVQGARDQNEDAHNSCIKAEHYAFSYVADGHGGSVAAAVLGSAFESAMLERSKMLDPLATSEEMVDCLRTAYQSATAEVDNLFMIDGLNSEGSTLSAYLLQYATMSLATLQLGDGMVIVADANRGDLISADTLFKVDDAGNDEYADFESCVTHQHSWIPESKECDRANRMLQEAGYLGVSIRACRRENVSEDEKRYDMVLDGIPEWSDAYAVECSRTLDLPNNGGVRLNRILTMIHRPAQYAVWALPPRIPLALIICCDGFVSKNAVPTPERIAKCVVNPEHYVRSVDCLNDTLIVCWGIVNRANIQSNENVVKKVATWVKQAVPDKMWVKAIECSEACIQRLRSDHDGCVPALKWDTSAAVRMACNIPVCLGSDDNVTLEVLYVKGVD